MTEPIDSEDVQGNILRGYRFPHVAHLFGRIDARRAGEWRRFLRSLSDQLTPAAWPQGDKPYVTLNVGISHRGLSILQPEVAAEVADTFRAYSDGMLSRARELGDGNAFDRRWEEHHVWLSLCAMDHERLDPRITELRTTAAGLELIEERPRGRAIEGPGGWYEHFGFRDDISFPAVEGTPNLDPAQVPGRGKYDETTQTWRTIATGEFLLGHPNESATDPLAMLSGDARALLMNGTFAAFRRLRQNVPLFRRYLQDHAGSDGASYLASRMMGRQYDGAALAATHGENSNFTYKSDESGARCPLGAHVRRVNPRTTGRHRVIRRGMTFGPPLAANEDDAADRGIWFIAFNASIEDQFEFVQKRWMNGPVGTLTDSRDPVAGAGSTRAFAVEGDQAAARDPVLLLDLPEFVTCQGGQYYFVPGRRGLRLLSMEGASPRRSAPLLYGVT